MSVSPRLTNIGDFSLSRIWLRRDVLAGSCALNVLGLVMPIMVLQVYDRVLSNQSINTLVVLTVIAGVTVALEFALRSLRALTLSAAGARYDHRVSLKAFAHILDTDLSSFERQTANAYVEEFRAIQRVKDFYAQQALTLVADVPFLFVFLALLAFIAGWLALIPVIIIACFVAVAYGIAERSSAIIEERDQADERRFNFLIEAISGVQTVKSLAMERVLQRRHERLQKKSAGFVEQMTHLNTYAQAVSGFVSQIATVAIVAAGAPLVVSGDLSLGGLAATMMLTGRMMQPIVRGFTTWTRYQSINVLETKVDELFAQPVERLNGAPLQDSLKGDIVFEDVVLRFPGAPAPILNGLSLHIPPGEMIGISGDSASGKTTLLMLLNGLLRPTSGRILIDGQDINGLCLEELRRKVGLLPTNGVMMNGTFLENLTLFQEGATDRAIDISRALGLDNYMAHLPKGLKTHVGAIGSTPEGVRQRVAVARVLAQDPAVILFDKAYKSLDHESDQRLLALMKAFKGKRTVVMIASRPSYLRLCDRMFRLEKGRLVEKHQDALQASRPVAGAPAVAGAA